MDRDCCCSDSSWPRREGGREGERERERERGYNVAGAKGRKGCGQIIPQKGSISPTFHFNNKNNETKRGNKIM